MSSMARTRKWKFSHLKDFVGTKVRKSIDRLPFTADGYDRAKSILEERYRKESEIIKAYLKDILPTDSERLRPCTNTPVLRAIGV